MRRPIVILGKPLTRYDEQLLREIRTKEALELRSLRARVERDEAEAKRIRDGRS